MITTAAQATVATTVTVAPRDLVQIRNMKKIIRNGYPTVPGLFDPGPTGPGPSVPGPPVPESAEY